MSEDNISAVADDPFLTRRLRQALDSETPDHVRQFLLNNIAEHCGGWDNLCTQSFETADDAEAAMEAGLLTPGEFILVEGEPVFVDLASVPQG